MNKRMIIGLHVAAWTVLFLAPLTFLNHGNGVTPQRYLAACVTPLLQMVVFYTNYFLLTPKLFMRHHRRMFWTLNIVIVVSFSFVLHIWMGYAHSHFDTFPPKGYSPPRHEALTMSLFVLRDMFYLGLSAFMAATVVLAMNWQKSETARCAAETARTEAELNNLRAQIKPHFLLNTLNNIYALVAFDQAKAQKAIYELSQLLRHILYDNQQPTITMSEEIAFLENYIHLMQIRLSDNVEVTFQAECAQPQMPIAPMLFISLVENAFKHGISATGKSFVHIRIENGNGYVTCEIENSNNPKGRSDHSGHGIGLRQVRKRLELSYAGHYEWTCGTDENDTVYKSKITIRT